MGEVSEIGMDVFGTREKFKRWLNTPNFSLGDQKPIDLQKDSKGKHLFISELIRINYGIFI